MDDESNLQRRYYRLAEAAQGLGCSAADLLHLGAIGRVQLGIMMQTGGLDPRVSRTESGGYSFKATLDRREFAAVDRGYLQNIEADGCAHPSSVQLLDGYWVNEVTLTVRADQLWITAEDLDRISGAAPNKRKRPDLTQQWQEDEILGALRKLGYDPSSLPPRKPGKSGPKTAARSALSLSQKAFDKAWERLRADGRIRDQ